MTYKTDILILRPWSSNDVEDLYRYAKNPQVGSATGKPAHTNIRENAQVPLSDETRTEHVSSFTREK